MSGGTFDYDQYRIRTMWQTIQSVIDKAGTIRNKDERYHDPDWYKKYPEDLYHETYPEEVTQALKDAVKVLKIAEVYAQRADWFLAGDDGPESFLRRLKEELNNIKDL
jgi:hypothetical protein